ncbi:MAG: hypothetical protein H6839_08555 [Planctomycetes bacterium]|nr:hypothetical protein [Planctomycetota bacterium]
MKTVHEDSEARRELHTRLIAQLASQEKKRSWLLLSMSAPALGLLVLIVYRFVASLP